MTLPARFDRHLAAMALPAGRALVAVSGGGDSLALLELLAQAPGAAAFELHVAHADHGIHPDSGLVAEAVREAAARHGLPCHVARLALGPGTSETAAREARYAWLASLAGELGAELIFTAHHRDDQVETILMRVFKGSGPAGLAGIPPRRGRLVRPLLPYRREELAGYLHQAGLAGWDDPANRDPRHQRSWIRTEVLPVLRRGIPDLDRRILALGRQAAADRVAWDALLERLPELDLKVAGNEVSVAGVPLLGYDSSTVQALLGALGRRADCRIGPQRAARIHRLLGSGRSGAVAELGAGWAAELSFGRLRLFRGPTHPPLWEAAVLAGASGSVLAGGWRITWEQRVAPARLERVATASWFTEGRYLLRPWRAGDRIRPLGAGGRRLVVRCMQDARIPRTQRTAWPVLESGGTLVWVPGACRSDERLPVPHAQALRIDANLA